MVGQVLIELGTTQLIPPLLNYFISYGDQQITRCHNAICSLMGLVSSVIAYGSNPISVFSFKEK